MFSRLVWTCLDPSSPQKIVVFVFVVFFVLFWVVNHSKLYFTLEKACVWTAKVNIVLDHVMYLGNKMPFARPQPACLYFK